MYENFNCGFKDIFYPLILLSHKLDWREEGWRLLFYFFLEYSALIPIKLRRKKKILPCDLFSQILL